MCCTPRVRVSSVLRNTNNESERQHAVAAEYVVHLPLDRSEAREPARLALEVVDNARQRLEIHPASPIRTMVEALLV